MTERTPDHPSRKKRRDKQRDAEQAKAARKTARRKQREADHMMTRQIREHQQ